MGFTKLDEGILQSSIMASDPVTFKVWIALLAACESDGVARVAPTFLAAVCHLSLEQVRRTLSELSGPDPDSRTPDHQGRRIERVDGGWRLINYRKYRSLGLKEAESEARSDRRHRTPDVRTLSGQSPDCSASASASASASVGEGVQGEGVFYRRPPGPANPLIAGRRAEIERECLTLVREVAEITGDDPVEVIAQASGYEGAATTKLNPASMSDDRLANTVRDLRTDLAELRKRKAVSHG